MSVSVVIPYRRGAEPARERAWAFVEQAWAAWHPDFEVVVADAAGAFSRARSLNLAVERAAGDTLILADADCLLQPNHLFQTLALLEHDRRARWGYAWDHLLRAGPIESKRMTGSPVLRPRWPATRRARPRRSLGGICVVERSAWDELGGFDERFEGWGAEDDWLAEKLRDISPAIYGPGVLIHLWHPRPLRRKTGLAYARNVALLEEARST